MPNDQKNIIEAIRNENYSELDIFFEELATKWKSCKFSKSIILEDSEDIFQDSVISLILRIRSNKSFDHCVYAYFMSICKNKLFDKVKRTGKSTATILPVISEDAEMKERKYQLFKACFKKMSANCRKLFNMRFNGMSSKEIALKLGIKANNVDQKLFSCREALRKCVENNPVFNQI